MVDVGDLGFAQRFTRALAAHGMDRAAFARAMGPTGQQTVNQWIKRGKIGQPSFARVRELLPDASIDWLNDGIGTGPHPQIVRESAASYAASQPVKLDTLTLALELAAEALEERGLSLPTPKRASLTASLYALLEEGMPRAKVLHFARVAVG